LKGKASIIQTQLKTLPTTNLHRSLHTRSCTSCHTPSA